MEIDDEMLHAARLAALAETRAWQVKKSPIVGSGVMFLHDANRDRPTPVDSEATFTEYRCLTADHVAEIIAQHAWRAGLEAAVALHNLRQKKETIQ